MAVLSPERFITLGAGMVVPIEPYLLLHRLESAGFHFKLDTDGVPLVAPFHRLTPNDLAELRRWRHHVAMLIAYVADDSHLRDPPATAPAVRRAS